MAFSASTSSQHDFVVRWGGRRLAIGLLRVLRPAGVDAKYVCGEVLCGVLVAIIFVVACWLSVRQPIVDLSCYPVKREPGRDVVDALRDAEQVTAAEEISVFLPDRHRFENQGQQFAVLVQS